MVIKIIYTLFLGIMVALFVGLGIAAFYPAPERPEYPRELYMSEAKPLTEPATESPEVKAKRAAYEEEINKYDKEISPAYNRNVSIIAVIAAVLTLIISLISMRKIDIISDGLLLGGVILLGYSIIRGLMSSDNVLTLFIVTAVGLVTALVVGYMRFIRTHELVKK